MEKNQPLLMGLRVMEKNIETTIVSWGHIEIMEKTMHASILVATRVK